MLKFWVRGNSRSDDKPVQINTVEDCTDSQIEYTSQANGRQCEISSGVWNSFAHIGVGGPVLKN